MASGRDNVAAVGYKAVLWCWRGTGEATIGGMNLCLQGTVTLHTSTAMRCCTCKLCALRALLTNGAALDALACATDGGASRIKCDASSMRFTSDG